MAVFLSSARCFAGRENGRGKKRGECGAGTGGLVGGSHGVLNRLAKSVGDGAEGCH